MNQTNTGTGHLLMNPRCLPSRFSIEEERGAIRPSSYGRHASVELRPAAMFRVIRRHFAARVAVSRNLSAATW